MSNEDCAGQYKPPGNHWVPYAEREWVGFPKFETAGTSPGLQDTHVEGLAAAPPPPNQSNVLGACQALQGQYLSCSRHPGKQCSFS